MHLSVSSQELTGLWSGSGSVWTAEVCDISVSTSVSGLQGGASVDFYTPRDMGCNIPSTYSSFIFNKPSLDVYLRFGSNGKGICTFTFSKPVLNPILHIDRLGGGYFPGPNSNSALLTLITSGLSLSKLSGNGTHFEVTANTITRTPNQLFGSTTTGECGLPNVGGASGSIRINGVVTIVSFEYELNGNAGNADSIEVIWELDSCDFDFDQDGILDKDDLDDDNDGILDTIELNGDPLLDTDKDGLIDSFDLDSDNDGCFDVIEAGFDDPDANGTLGDLPDTVDSDGLIINESTGYTLPLDSDANTILDFQEAILPVFILQPNARYVICEQSEIKIPIAVSNSSSIRWEVSLDSGITWEELDRDSVYFELSRENIFLRVVPLSYSGYWYRAKLDEFCNTPVYSDVFELVVLKIPDTGIDEQKILCADDAPQDLINFLNGTPDPNGVWSPALSSGTGVFNPSVDAQGVYTYSIDNGYCSISQSTVNVKIPSVIVQPESTITICEKDNLVIPITTSDAFTVQWQVSSDLGVSWTDLTSNSIFSGVDTDNLQLSNVPLTFNGSWFRAIDAFCTSITSTDIIELTVLKLPYAGTDGNKVFCIGASPEDLIVSLGDNPDLNGTWAPALNSGTGMFNPAIDQEGVYTFTVDSGFCMDQSVVNVQFSDKPTSMNVDIIDNSSNNSMVVNVSGIGDYEYSIDGENYQDSNLFDNLSPNVYKVYVKDKNGCGNVLESEEDVIGYPKFFTPNGDGVNELWNIKGGKNTEYVIYIYDRYGKLLKSFDNSSLGWNGEFNNLDMPSSDYWFHFITSDGRKIIGHFTLKR